MLLNIDDTICLIIDYQERLTPSINHISDIIINSKKLINGLNILDIPLIVTEQYKKGLKETINDIKNISTSAKYFEKTSFSCIKDQNILDYIKNSNKKNIIICGIEAHICILQSAIDLKDLGYNVIVVCDAIGSRKELDYNIALSRLKQEKITLTTVESLLFELIKDSTHIKFKDISNIIK